MVANNRGELNSSFMTATDPVEAPQPGPRVVLLAFSGDSGAAVWKLRERFSNATVVIVPRQDIEGESWRNQLRVVRALKPDVFAVLMESVDWQRGKNLLLVFGSITGAKHVVLLDNRGGFKEETQQELWFKAPQRLTREARLTAWAIIKSKRELTKMEAAVSRSDKSDTSPAAIPNSNRHNSNLKILFLRATPGAGTHAGGAATHINGFVNAAVDLGASVEMIANDQIAGLNTDKVPLRIIPLEPSGLTRSAFDLHNNLVFSAGVKRALRDVAPDLIYQRYSRFTWAGVEASLLTKRPLFLEYNGSEVWVGKYWDAAGMFPLLERFERLNLSAAIRIFVVSEVERRNLIKAGVPDLNIVVNPNGVDVERFKPGVGRDVERKKLGLSQDEILVGFVGTFGPWHGVLELAKAIVLSRQDSRIKYLLIGEGKLRESVAQIIAETGMGDRVIFTGAVKHDRVPQLLDACDILVSPHVPLAGGAEFFGSPTKLFEYMAMGKAIVASRLGQIAEVLRHEETALLVEPGNAEELSRAIIRLVASPGLRETLGATARQTAKAEHTWRRNAENILDAYQAWRNEVRDT